MLECNIPQAGSEPQAQHNAHDAHSYGCLPRWLARAAGLTFRDPDHYFDKVQVWLGFKLTKEQKRELGRLCLGGIHVGKRWMKWQPRWKQRVQLYQPSMQAVELLSEIAGTQRVLINHLELACDYAFPTVNELDAAFELVSFAWVRRWHRASQGLRIVGEGRAKRTTKRHHIGPTRYDGGRKAANRTATYREEHTRTTGELNCLHLEWRTKTARACEALKVVELRHLLEFDHEAFWSGRLKHLYAIDAERLGRVLRNRRCRTRTQRPLLRQWEFRGCVRVVNRDERLGDAAVNAAGTVQGVVDELGMPIVRRALVPLSCLTATMEPPARLRLAGSPIT